MSDTSSAKPAGSVKNISQHYNSIVHDERTESKIYQLRCFHNWIKSVLIDDACQILTVFGKSQKPIKVLDLCCGKGGDFSKWRINHVSYLAAVDIADRCVEECKERYFKFKKRDSKIYSFEAHVVDMGVDDLSKILNIKTGYNMASCQFSLHYLFESHEKACNFINNLAECIEVKGIFIATLPNAYEIMRRLRKVDGFEFGNEYYNIRFDSTVDKNQPNLFGEKYHFELDEVVNLPEYLVYFPLLEKMLEKVGFRLLYRMNFSQALHGKIKSGNNHFADLMKKMKCFETRMSDYKNSSDDTKLKYYKDFTLFGHKKLPNFNSERLAHFNTVSKNEWEITTLYDVVLFEKFKNTSERL